MSIANGTTHYDYPQVQLTDRPTFADFNPAFQDIDAKLYGLITGATTDHAAIEALQTGLGETNLALAGVKDTADAAKAKADANEENIGILQTSLGNTDRTVATKLDSVAIAEPYDAGAGTYAVGDVVVYNGQRYRCTTAVAVAEPFDADKWTGEDVETVLEQIFGNLAFSSEPITLPGNWDGRVTFYHNNYIGYIEFNARCTNRVLDGTQAEVIAIPSGWHGLTGALITNSNDYAHAITMDTGTSYQFTFRGDLAADTYLIGVINCIKA